MIGEKRARIGEKTGQRKQVLIGGRTGDDRGANRR